jgi:hypothetical protein
VGRTDFALFAQGYGSSYEMAPPSPSPTTAAVPEPASWLLAVAGLSAMTYGVWRKRRAST